MNASSGSSSSETILNFSMQVKARIPLYSTQKNTRTRMQDEVEKMYFKNRYCPQVLLDNWFEEQLQYEQEDSFLKLKRGPNETTYDVEFKVPYVDDFAAFNKSTKGMSHKLMTFYKNPTEYSVNYYRVKKDALMKTENIQK